MRFSDSKFELDNLLSEKRIILLSANGGLYQSYHFIPLNDGTNFGLGDNQIGVELMGHSPNSYTRYSVAALTSTDGEPGTGAGSSYDAAFTLSHALDAGSMGVERFGVYAYVGQRPTVFQTTDTGSVILPYTSMRKTFYRVGFTGNFSFGNLELLPFLMHASDDKALTAGTQNAIWNAGLLEAHYFVNPQLAFLGRYEAIRMHQQADPTTPSDQGNVDAFTIGLRRYVFMFSRAGLAMHGEYSLTKSVGIAPLSGDGTGGAPLTAGPAGWSSRLLLAVFKCRSTPTGTLPTDEDVFNAMTRGFVTTNMPQWLPLTSQNRADLVAYIKSFSPKWKTLKPGTPIAIPAEPRLTIESILHGRNRSEEHTSELQSLAYLVCRLLLEKKKK